MKLRFKKFDPAWIVVVIVVAILIASFITTFKEYIRRRRQQQNIERMEKQLERKQRQNDRYIDVTKVCFSLPSQEQGAAYCPTIDRRALVPPFLHHEGHRGNRV